MTTTSNISRTRRTIAQHDNVDRVQIDGDQSGAIFRALVDSDGSEETVDVIENELELDVHSVQHVGFGVEVEFA
jgi:hypothetical protein